MEQQHASSSAASIIDHQASAVVVHIQARDLGEEHMHQLEHEVESAARAEPGSPFVLDMANVKYVPSLTLGALVGLARGFKTRHQRLVLASLQPTVRQVIALTRLDRLFETAPDVATALKNLA